MKKELLFAAVATTALAGCMDDSIVQDTPLKGNSDGRISFVQKTSNMTKGTTRAELANHYEFGVFGFRGQISDDQAADDNVNNIMPNYLVAYADVSSNYASFADIKYAQTWGPDIMAGETTVPADKISSWIYEYLGAVESEVESTGTKSQNLLQDLKYWDKSYDYHYFVAYTPYLNADQANPATANTSSANETDLAGGAAESVTLDEVTPVSPATAVTDANLTFTGLSAFYTTPAVNPTVANKSYQPLGVDLKGKQSTTYFNATAPFETYTGGGALTSDNKEIINANEANYAYANIERANYGKDVPLTFKHVNAKIQVAFYEQIKGYSVKLIDLVPENVPSNQKSPIVDAKKSTIANGVVWTPATVEQTNINAAQTAKASLSKYIDKGNVEVAGVSTAGSNHISYTAAPEGSNDNLYFAIGNAKGGNHSDFISEIGNTSATKLSTVYYALPNYHNVSASPVTPDYLTNVPAAMKQTGFTVHVSYELIPNDGTAKTTVYDARVYVKPEYCRWEAGKAYTYIFKLTRFSNGTTNPNLVDPYNSGTTDEPYIDPDDPRIPEDPALEPIVFDGVLVTDYEYQETGKENEHETWQITDATTWTKAAKEGTPTTAQTNYLAQLVNNADFVTALSDSWEPAIGDFGAANATFDAATHVFTMKSAASTNYWTIAVSATGKGENLLSKVNAGENDTKMKIGTITPSFTCKDVNGTDLADGALTTAQNAWRDNAAFTNMDFATLTAMFWSKDDGTEAVTFTATPSAIIVNGEVTKVVTTTKTDLDGAGSGTRNLIKVVTQKNDGTTETKYYDSADENLDGSDTEIVLANYTAILAVSGESEGTPTVETTYGYKYVVTAYAVSKGGAAAHTGVAYPVVKKITPVAP